MTYEQEFSPTFKKKMVKLKKKDKILFQRLTKKIKEILQYPEHYKPLGNVLKGKRAAHVGSFVIIFKTRKDVVYFLSFKHHNHAY